MIEKRKEEHINICATKQVQAKYNYWEDLILIHQALPELNMPEIDLEISLFNKKLQAPIIISGITGGYSKAKKINSNLASAASELQIGLGLGSQRPMLERSKYIDSYKVVKDFDVPLVIGNLGAPQLVSQNKKDKPLTLANCKSAMEAIGADILAIHMNFVQEIIQPEGDVNAYGCLDRIKELASELPILAKETGAGISKQMAIDLKSAGVKGIDVGGVSGTSFAAVETYRGKAIGDVTRVKLGKLFWDWGIPTPVSLFEANVGLPLIGTGGIWSGLDAAKALCLGASAAGMARRLLEPAMKSTKAVIGELEQIIEELRCALFLMGTKNASEVKRKQVIITGRTKEILDSLRYDL